MLGKSKNVNMLEGPVVKGILGLTLPIMLMNVLQSMFNIIDSTVLKMFGTDGGTAIGAVGVCGVLITLITCLVIGVSAGANVAIAKHIGRKDPEAVERAVHTSIAFAAVGGVIVMVIGILGAELFLTWMNCPKELLPQAALYFRLYFAGVPIAAVYNFSAAILRASGDTRRPMMYSIFGGVVKVVLTFAFTAFFKAGVVGVAMATIASWLLSATLALRKLTHTDTVVRLSFRKVRFHKEELKQVLHVGIPAGLQQALYSIANVLIVTAVNASGPAAATGMSIANNYDNLMYQVSVAPSLAVMSYVSQNVGAGNIGRAQKSVRSGMLLTVCMGGTLGALSAIFSGPLASIMTDNPTVIMYAQQKMILVSSTYFICGINEILGASLRGLGKPTVPTASTLIFMCLLRLPWVWFIYPLVPGNLTFLYLIWPIGWILSLATELFWYFPTIKKLRARHATL